MKKIISENLKTLIYAFVIAVIIRSFLYQPFYIPSSSMEPTLLVGDRIFVSKYSYGYSRHSFPFSPNISSKRFFKKTPKRGDVVVFKTPQDNRTDYVKRLIGLPGDSIQFVDGDLYLNENKIERRNKIIDIKINLPGTASIYEEILPEGKKYTVAYSNEYNLNKSSDKYIVPPNKYFFMGDNRDNSTDSRTLSKVGYVSEINLVGKVNFIFFSNDKNSGSFFEFWNWSNSIRFKRFFNKIE